MRRCNECKKILEKRFQITYCSNKCQADNRYRNYIEIWKSKNNKNDQVSTGNISGHIRRYFIEKYGEQCSICGWNKKNPRTDQVPIEIDHIDGNSNNNSEKNLQLICPNCHSLTPFYKNLNKGNGRSWRTARYMRVSKKV